MAASLSAGGTLWGRRVVAIMCMVEVAAGRIMWTRVEGFMPTGIGDLESGQYTLEEARTFCAQRVDCTGFTVARRHTLRPAGVMVNVFFKRTVEYFVDTKNEWVSFIKQRTPCKRKVYRSHSSGLLCCDGVCPGLAGGQEEEDCDMPTHVEHGDIAACSALDAKAMSSAGLADPLVVDRCVRDLHPARVFNLVILGQVEMSSAYDGGPRKWMEAAAAIDGDHGPESMVHTECKAGEWWQLYFPQFVEVHQVHITNRQVFQYRMLDVALVAFGGVDGGERLGEWPIRRSFNRSSFVFSPPLRAVTRLLLQSPKSRAECLHFSEITVLGRMATDRSLHGAVLSHLAMEHEFPRRRPRGLRTGGRHWPGVPPPFVLDPKNARMWAFAVLTTCVLLVLQLRTVRSIVWQEMG